MLLIIGLFILTVGAIVLLERNTWGKMQEQEYCMAECMGYTAALARANRYDGYQL